MMKQWWFSLTILCGYLSVFHLWMMLEHPMVIFSGVAWGTAFSVIMYIAFRQQYFANRYDIFWHSTVIVDVLLESIFITVHDHYGFYGCATAFSLVIGFYHWKSMTRLQAVDFSQPRSTVKK